MKTRTIIVVVIVASVAGIVSVWNSQSMMPSIMTQDDCHPNELLHDGECIKIDVPEHIGSFSYGTDSITSYCEDISELGDGFGLDRCIRIEFLDIDELLARIQDNSTEPLTWPSSKMLAWCAERFDHTKHEFQENLKKNPECHKDICPEYEPPLFESALNSDEEFIKKGCVNFVDKWAYMTEDNDYTWSYANWESFVKPHHMHPVDDPQRNEKCAKLFDLIYQSKDDSDLWYELTETDEFRDAKCASIVEDWEHLTEHNVWDIGISWKKVAELEEAFEDDDSFESVPRCKGEALCLTEKITRIIDGDTLYLGDYKIRLSLTNTPERHESGFHDASRFTVETCPVGTVALVDQDDLQPYDVYDRILGKVVCGDKILNSELLYAGHANILTQYCSTSEFSEEVWAQEFGC